MSDQSPQPDHSPADPSVASSGPRSNASTAWAIATSVIAVAAAFLIYTWITEDNASEESATVATSSPTVSQSIATESTATESTAAGSTASESASADEAAQSTASLTPEQEAFLLDLQRRDPDDPMALGEVNAPVVLIEYADYRCPFCATWAQETKPGLDDLVEDGTLRIEYRDIAILGEDSLAASIAARAAGEQGLYWEYHDALFDVTADGDHPSLPTDKLLDLAEQVGVPDLDTFEQDLDSPELREAVATETDTARELGITSTPTFIINTVPLQGAQPLDTFRQVIASEAQKAGS
ncbi:MAG: thioredoxin domain-containing protein [Ornithinimicrobium sp.]